MVRLKVTVDPVEAAGKVRLVMDRNGVHVFDQEVVATVSTESSSIELQPGDRLQVSVEPGDVFKLDADQNAVRFETAVEKKAAREAKEKEEKEAKEKEEKAAKENKEAREANKAAAEEAAHHSAAAAKKK